MRRQRVDVLLPGEGGAPDEGGVKQQFTAARAMVEATLLRLKQLPPFQACCCAPQLAWQGLHGDLFNCWPEGFSWKRCSAACEVPGSHAGACQASRDVL